MASQLDSEPGEVLEELLDSDETRERLDLPKVTPKTPVWRHRAETLVADREVEEIRHTRGSWASGW